MIFLHPWFAFAALASFLWAAWKMRASDRRLATILKGASFIAILLALAEPNVTLPRTRVALLVLVDTSRSISNDDLQHASAVVDAIAHHISGNSLQVLPFARNLEPLRGGELKRVRFGSASGQAASATNIESALSDALARLPEGYVPRILLLSDGNENEGSVIRAGASFQELRVPVDVIPLSGRSGASLRLESVSIPGRAYAGEQIPIDLAIHASDAVDAAVSLSANGNTISSSSVHLNPGLNTTRLMAHLKSAGAISVAGDISARTGSLHFEEGIELNRAKVLFISQDPPSADTNLLSALNQAELEVSRDTKMIETDLSRFQLVILNNIDLDAFNPEQKQKLEAFVQNGGGLLVIGGERQQYKDEAKFDALDRALPARIAPPETPRGTTVALIIDKSSSMEGRKIELARLSAIGVVEHLRPIDSIGVLIFDNSFQWAVPLRRAADKGLIKRLIAGITPDGGTQIAPALTEAYRRILPTKAAFKHIVLLTDGISEEGDSIDLAREAQDHQVTISTVGLGQDVNRSYLEKVAAVSGGRSYFLNEPQGLEQILLKDVQDYTGSTAVEKPLKPIVERPVEVLEDVDMASAPALKGYARYVAKPGAESILAIGDQKRDPLFVRWQYGLGRAAVFASDAKSRWAEQWISWPGFDKFWINVVRDLLPRAARTEASAHYDSATGNLVVTYRESNEVSDPAKIPPIYAVGPGGFRQRVVLQRTDSRTYQGQAHIGELTGFFRIRPVLDSDAFPEVGFHRSEPELSDYGTNESLLKEIAAETGGRFNPALNRIFDPSGRIFYTSWRLWPGLLGLAIAFTMAELLVRKWAGVRQLLSPR